MKNVFLTIAVLLTTLTTQARSIDLTPVLATVSGYEEGIEQVALLADGRLQVVYQAETRDEKYRTYRVTDAVLKRLTNEVMNLGQVEVKETNSIVVCMMMPMPTLSNLSLSSYNYETQSFSRKLRLVLTAQNCAVGHKVSPVDAYAKTAAEVLRAQLVILALNAQ